MAKKIAQDNEVSLTLKSHPFLNKILKWKGVPSLLGHWRLKDGDKVVASLKWTLAKGGNFSFKGLYEGRGFEIKHLSGKPINWNKTNNNVVIYAIFKEDKEGEWRSHPLAKQEWGRLIHGFGNCFSPSKLVVNDEEYSIICNCPSLDRREFLFGYQDGSGNTAVLGLTKRSRIKPDWTDMQPGSFELINFMSGNIDPILIALVSFAFSEMVKTVFDGGL